jgi:hypothetical protein
MSTDDAGLLPFLKLNAERDEKCARDYEWVLLQELKGSDEGILGLRLVEDAGGERSGDLVHLLVSPHCSRERLSMSLGVPEVKSAPKHAAGTEPGHYVPVNADRLNQALRGDYFVRLKEMSEAAQTRQATPEEMAEIARIRQADTGLDVTTHQGRHEERFFTVGDLPPEGRPERLGPWRALRQLQIVLTPLGASRPGGAARALFQLGRVAGDQLQVIILRSNYTTARVMLEAFGFARREIPVVDELTDRLPESGEVNRHTHYVVVVGKSRFEQLLVTNAHQSGHAAAPR